MFKQILIGVDGRQGGRDAIALARQLATPDTRFTFAHVGESHHGRSDELLAAAREQADLDAELVAVAHARVGAGLHQLAERVGADLLAVGSSRHGTLGRVLIGDDARATLHGASCSVAIASHRYADAPHPLQRLGVGYDGTAESDSALAEARELAARNQARIKALWVVSLEDVQHRAPVPADWPEAIEQLLTEHTWRLEQLGGLDVDSVYGGPREELAGLSERVDLLVVGSHRHAHAHGGIPRYLADHAACPLLVTSAAQLESDGVEARTEHVLSVAAGGFTS